MKSFKKLINQYKEINNSISGIEFNDIYFLPSDKSIFSINPIFKNRKIIKPQIYLQLDPEFSKSQYISIPKILNIFGNLLQIILKILIL